MTDRALSAAKVFVLFVLVTAVPAAAFQANTSGTGSEIKWSSPLAVYYLNPAGAPAGSEEAVQRALGTWSSVPTSSFAFTYGGTTTNSSWGVRDRVNILTFGPMDESSVLAANYFWFTTDGRLLDSDIKFNTRFSLSTDGSSGGFDLESLALHELGHSLSLSDLYNPGDNTKVMYGYLGQGWIKRSLHQDDIDGISHLYPVAQPVTYYTLAAARSGTGSGTVSSTPPGIDCGEDCTESYISSTLVTLTATPSSGSAFSGWSGGACSGIGTCTLTMNAAANVTAVFTKTFSDISPSYWAYEYINALYESGITTGCGGGRYCPSDRVTRAQMAAFIVRANFGEDFSYTVTPYFSDVPASTPYFKYVQKLKDEGITTVSSLYDSEGEVTRGQAAAFIVRAKFGESFSYTATPYFSDVPAENPYFRYVQKLKDEGITTVSGQYAIDTVIPRDQMAALLSRAFLGMP
ncbi:MAG: S-layer homology domain-containing protein [Alphaproteobacteria bacterium]|uniref:S-layer homology domain-containing protein n=1 Tax=Candidatus Nitrobium versatile TaxID=2884831 RepID=A0A953JCJ1_9BACT|nr:S-layer homology domain-containing protein [Candidatus Nitrobium versatile]